MITVTLPYPISANRYWASRIVKPKSGGKPFVTTYVTTEAELYKTEVAWRLRSAGVHQPVAGRVHVHVDLFPKRPQDWQKRMRTLGAAWDDGVQCLDLDNVNKVLFDAIKGIAIEDDSWPVRKITSERREPDGEARVVLTITPIVVEQPQGALL